MPGHCCKDFFAKISHVTVLLILFGIPLQNTGKRKFFFCCDGKKSVSMHVFCEKMKVINAQFRCSLRSSIQVWQKCILRREKPPLFTPFNNTKKSLQGWKSKKGDTFDCQFFVTEPTVKVWLSTDRTFRGIV